MDHNSPIGLIVYELVYAYVNFIAFLWHGLSEMRCPVVIYSLATNISWNNGIYFSVYESRVDGETNFRR